MRIIVHNWPKKFIDGLLKHLNTFDRVNAAVLNGEIIEVSFTEHRGRLPSNDYLDGFMREIYGYRIAVSVAQQD